MFTFGINEKTMQHIAKTNKNPDTAIKVVNLQVILIDIFRDYLEDITPIENGVRIKLRYLPKIDIAIDWDWLSTSIEEGRIDRKYEYVKGKKLLFKGNKLYIIPSKGLEKREYIESQARSFVNRFSINQTGKEFYELFLDSPPIL